MRFIIPNFQKTLSLKITFTVTDGAYLNLHAPSGLEIQEYLKFVHYGAENIKVNVDAQNKGNRERLYF